MDNVKKILLSALPFLLVFLSAYANPVDVRTALALGQKFAENKFERVRVSGLHLAHTVVLDGDVVCLYVFNVGEEGFVMVSADDRAHPILGYSEHNAFDVNNMAPGLNYMTGYYARGIAYAIANDIPAGDEIESEWKALRNSGRVQAASSAAAIVGPLLSTTWNQDDPYNCYCPSDADGPGGHVYAGCVATAMAQIMKYWNFPAQGAGSHSYTPEDYLVQSVNFGATTYDWSNMPDYLYDYSSTGQIQAVARLIYHCGVSVDMDYSPDGSGAYSESVPEALQSHFGYASCSIVYKDYYYSSETAWQEDLKAALDAGRPVYYSGGDEVEEAGHAFVCDGYDSDNLFHFNWGWDGYDNGYFVTNALTANDSHFNDEQAAIMDIEPDNMCLRPLNAAANDITDSSATITWAGSGTFELGYKAVSATAWTTSTVYTNHTSLSALQPSAYYDWRVRRVCIDGYSEWVGGTFRTAGPCVPVTMFPYTEDFDSGTLPDCWTAVDSDGDGYSWDPEFGFDSGQSHSGIGMMASASYINGVGALSPDNWLITPQIAVGTSPLTLSFWVRGHASSYPAEHYGVYISAAGTDASDFTPLYQGVASAQWEKKTVTIGSQYAGQTVYIAFRHYNTTDQYWLDLDDVSIAESGGTAGPSVDYALYSFCDEGGNLLNAIALQPGEGLGPWAILTNNGPDVPAAADTVYADITINGEGFGSLYMIGGDLADLTAGMHTTLYMSGDLLTAAEMDAYGLEDFEFCYTVRIAGEAVDPVPSNNRICIQVTRGTPVTPPPSVDYALDNFCDGDGNVLNTIALQPGEGLSPRVTLTNNGPDVPAAADTVCFDIAADGEGLGSLYLTGSDLADVTAGMHTTLYMNGDLLTAAEMDAYGLEDFELCYTVSIAGEAVDPVASNNRVCIQVTRVTPVELCEEPAGLAAGNITATSAALSWTGAGDFEVGYKISADYSWTTQLVSGNSLDVIGLEYATGYTWRVRKVCGNDDYSDWAESSFQTAGVGIESGSLAHDLKLYPNPAASYIDVKFGDNLQADALSVYDIYGKLLQTVRVTENPVRVDVSGYAQGMYFVRVYSPDGIVNAAFVRK